METDSTDNTDDENTDESAADSRPIGYWLRTVDAYLTREFARAFEAEGISRRDWMLLNVVAGDVKAPGFAERVARKGKRLRGLEQRGWVQETGDGSWILTDDGRAAKERLGGIVDDIRSRVAGAVSPKDYATTLASLEAIARELGWDENERTPWTGFGRGFGRGFGQGFGPGSRHGYGPGFGPDGRRGFWRDMTSEDAAHVAEHFGHHRGHHGFGPGFSPEDAQHFAEHFGHHRGHHIHDRDDAQSHRGHGHGNSRHGDSRHDAERAYERGFDAGFSRGQSGS